MAETTDVQRDLVKAMYEQHWLHARHVEHERLLVTNVYAILLAGTIAAYRGDFFGEDAYPAHVLLMLLAIFCAFFSIKIDAIFKGHTQRAESLVESYGLPSPLRDLVASGWVDRWIRISRLFPGFFLLSFCFLLAVLLSYRADLPRACVYVACSALFVLLYFGLDRLAYDSSPRRYSANDFPIRTGPSQNAGDLSDR